jgi:hypothetical protein
MLSMDHSLKVLRAQQINGTKVLRYRLTMMDNMTGAVVLGISVASASMDDLGFAEAAKALVKLHPELQWLVLWIDNPYRDLQGTVRRFGVLGAPLGHQYLFEGAIKICTAECTEADLGWLTNDGEFTVLGFDLEWVPSLQRGVSPSPVALIQLCAGERCLLVRTHQSKILSPALCALLMSATLVGVNIKSDLTKLVKDFPNLDVKRLAAKAIDVAVVVRKSLPNHSKSLKEIVLSVTGKTLVKPSAGDAVNYHQHWGDLVLRSDLVQYAAADAASGLEVYNVLTGLSTSEAEKKHVDPIDTEEKHEEPIDPPDPESIGPEITDYIEQLLGFDISLRDQVLASELELEEPVLEFRGPFEKKMSLETAQRVVSSFAAQEKIRTLRLPGSFTSEERRELHAFADQLELNHSSEDDSFGVRQLVVRKLGIVEEESADKGVDPEWAAGRVKYDPKHWLGNVFSIARTGSPLYGVFCSTMADALFKPRPGERDRVMAHFRKKGMFNEQIDRLPRKVFRAKMRMDIPEPKRIVKDVMAVVDFFSLLTDPQTGSYFFHAKWASTIKKELDYVKRGLLSDPPGLELYVSVGFLSTGLEIFRCARGHTIRSCERTISCVGGWGWGGGGLRDCGIVAFFVCISCSLDPRCPQATRPWKGTTYT